ncbi:hypothetical protein LR013_00390 [candidate division NPL-UPA2 bacterium]|nr:hypothetical protein [candidate division NPL-UPA2 bacterium]
MNITGSSAPAANEKEVYILLTIDSADIEEVRHWFEDFCNRNPLEAMFVADIKGKPPLERPIGLAALIKFTPTALKSGILEIREELRAYTNWRYELMRADWIEIKSFEKAANESKRKVQTDGRICFRNHRYYITQRLRGEEVDLKIDNSSLKIYYNGILLKTFAGIR